MGLVRIEYRPNVGLYRHIRGVKPIQCIVHWIRAVIACGQGRATLPHGSREGRNIVLPRGQSVQRLSRRQTAKSGSDGIEPLSCLARQSGVTCVECVHQHLPIVS